MGAAEVEAFRVASAGVQSLPCIICFCSGCTAVVAVADVGGLGIWALSIKCRCDHHLM